MPIFGSTVTSAFIDRTYNEVPVFLDRALMHLEDYGLKSEWIFYQDGNLEVVENIKSGIESKGSQFFFSPSFEPHDVSTVVKSYFQDLDEPVFPFQLYSRFIKCNLNVEPLQELVKVLPTPNRVIIQRLFLFFKKLSAFSSINMMTSYNISCTIANDLLRDSPPNAEDYNHIADVVACMIEHAPELFGGSAILKKTPSNDPLVPSTKQGKSEPSPPPKEELSEQEQWNKLLQEKNMLDEQAQEQSKALEEEQFQLKMLQQQLENIQKEQQDELQRTGTTENKEQQQAKVREQEERDAALQTEQKEKEQKEREQPQKEQQGPPPVPKKPPKPLPKKPAGLPPPAPTEPSPAPNPVTPPPKVPPPPQVTPPQVPPPPQTSPRPQIHPPQITPPQVSPLPEVSPPQVSPPPQVLPQVSPSPKVTPSPQINILPEVPQPQVSPASQVSSSPQVFQPPQVSQPPQTSQPVQIPEPLTARVPPQPPASAPVSASSPNAGARMSVRVPPRPPTGTAPHHILPAEPSRASIDPSMIPRNLTTTASHPTYLQPAPLPSAYPTGALLPQPPQLRPQVLQQPLRPQAPQARTSPMLQEQALAHHAHAQAQALVQTQARGAQSQWRQEGYLVKKGAKVRNWKTRWFRMDSSVIYYYKDRNNKTPLGNIVLCTMKNIFSVPSADVTKGFAFDVYTDTRNWSFIAYSAEERDKWIDAITRTSPTMAERAPQQVQIQQMLPQPPHNKQVPPIPQAHLSSTPGLPQHPSQPQVQQAPLSSPPALPQHPSQPHQMQQVPLSSFSSPPALPQYPSQPQQIHQLPFATQQPISTPSPTHSQQQQQQYYQLLQQQAMIEQRLQQLQAQGGIPPPHQTHSLPLPTPIQSDSTPPQSTLPPQTTLPQVPRKPLPPVVKPSPQS